METEKQTEIETSNERSLKRYCVSLVIKQNKADGVLNILNALNTNIKAYSSEEAFGIYFKEVQLKNPEHYLHTYLVSEI